MPDQSPYLCMQGAKCRLVMPDQSPNLCMQGAKCRLVMPDLSPNLCMQGAKCRLVMPDQSPNPNARLQRTVPTDIEKVTARFPPLHASSQHSTLTWNHEVKITNADDFLFWVCTLCNVQ